MRLILLLALAQVPDDRGEVAISQPTYQGTTASAPIPAELHIKNEGGTPEPSAPQGAGLCVISSILCNGMYQKVPGLEGGKQSQLWQTAKSRPGGYWPAKLEQLLREVLPDEKWVSYSGQDPAILDTLSAKGYPIGATMSTGAFYGYAPIHHMISLVHYQSGGLACVVDNNDPGIYHWMPASEFLRRWFDGGEGWAFAWSRLPALAKLSLITLAAALVLLAAAAVAGGGVLLIPEPDSCSP